MSSSSGGVFQGRFLLFSLALHGILLALLWWGGPRWKQEQPYQIRMVRLAGGGQGKAGWVSEDMSPDPQPAKPEPETEAVVEEAPAPARKEPTLARTPSTAAAPQKAPAREPRTPTRESEQALPTDGRQGRTRDTGAGPRGQGSSRTGALSDQPDAPGMSQYLTRVENGIQRAFKYPARSSGKRAVFHFIIDRAGHVEDLEQVVESGLPGLDLAGRSALMRAQLPPLPPAFPYDKIGVTFTFVDE
jgi:outer membrane biosynthesis protein TonB